MVGGFYRCTLKIEYAVPVFSVPQSAAQAVGLQQAPLRHRPPQAETSQPGCWVGGKRENTRCQELLYKNAFTASEQIGGGDPVWGLPLPVCSEKGKLNHKRISRNPSIPANRLVRPQELESWTL